MKTMKVLRQPDGSYKTVWTDEPYPDPVYEAQVQEVANRNPGFVAFGAQWTDRDGTKQSAEPQVLDLSGGGDEGALLEV